jgi:serine O-acetyltransferase
MPALQYFTLFNIIIRIPFYLPLLFTYIIIKNDVIDQDLANWKNNRNIKDTHSNLLSLIILFMTYKDFRSLFYFRVKSVLKNEDKNIIIKLLIYFLFSCVKLASKGMQNLYINGEIEGGLVFYHAFSTIISANSHIGQNCKIWQGVTIGFDEKGKAPWIGNNVRISTGAKIIGGIKIGDNCIIGPNALVVRSIPPNCVVVSEPSYIVKRDGKWVFEKLKNE